MTKEEAKFQRIEAWSMKELGFSTAEIAQEFGVSHKRIYNLLWLVKAKKEVPPSDDYCDFLIMPMTHLQRVLNQ